MTVSVGRPDIANLVMRTYGRSLHPELICHHMSRTVESQGMTLEIRLIPAGHALIFRHGKQVLTEIISEKDEVHPLRGRLFEHKLRGWRSEQVQFENTLRYDVCCSLEKASPTVFMRQHEELIVDGSRSELFCASASSHRFSPGPVSLIRAEVCKQSIVVHAFHTFPDQFAIVKTQSLFSLGVD